jgi:predicted SprT family Zn-dependent metalloprotease
MKILNIETQPPTGLQLGYYACNECQEHFQQILQVGEEPYENSSTAFLCFACAGQIAVYLKSFWRA